MDASDTIRSAGFIIFRRTSNDNAIEYLMMQGSKLKYWGPPKGKLEPGETVYEAAVRETREEAGLEEKDYDVVPNFKVELSYPTRRKPKVVTYWLAGLKEPDKTRVTLSDEHVDFKWLPLDEALKINQKFPNMQKALRQSEEVLRE